MNMQKKKLYLVRDDANLQLFSEELLKISYKLRVLYNKRTFLYYVCIVK